MASQTSDPDRSTVTLESFAQDVARRRAAAGEPALPRNAGSGRTASKQALLSALEAIAPRW